MKPVFCFGELLLRMSPALEGEWDNDASMPYCIGGAELNVATAIANWGLPVKYCTALPDNNLSEKIFIQLKGKKICTASIQVFGNKIGLYYLPSGSDLKNDGVIYDRKHSAFAELVPGMIDWEEELKGCSWFHFSAISPALSMSSTSVCYEALFAAQKLGLTISVDLNYRQKLWQYGKRPVDVMPGLVNFCDVVMGNIWAIETMLGMYVMKPGMNIKNDFISCANDVSTALMQKFTRCKTVANTFRFAHANTVKYYATMNKATGQFVSKEFTSDNVIDKVGSGDCFMAGLIYGISNLLSPQDVLDFATSAAFGKLHEPGDSTHQKVEQIKARI